MFVDSMVICYLIGKMKLHAEISFVELRVELVKREGCDVRGGYAQGLCAAHNSPLLAT
jgi:hypothetical protein